jgi:hypothetical protein
MHVRLPNNSIWGTACGSMLRKKEQQKKGKKHLKERKKTNKTTESSTPSRSLGNPSKHSRIPTAPARRCAIEGRARKKRRTNKKKKKKAKKTTTF